MEKLKSKVSHITEVAFQCPALAPEQWSSTADHLGKLLVGP